MPRVDSDQDLSSGQGQIICWDEASIMNWNIQSFLGFEGNIRTIRRLSTCKVSFFQLQYRVLGVLLLPWSERKFSHLAISSKHFYIPGHSSEHLYISWFMTFLIFIFSLHFLLKFVVVSLCACLFLSTLTVHETSDFAWLQSGQSGHGQVKTYMTLGPSYSPATVWASWQPCCTWELSDVCLSDEFGTLCLRQSLLPVAIERHIFGDRKLHQHPNHLQKCLGFQSFCRCAQDYQWVAMLFSP